MYFGLDYWQGRDGVGGMVLPNNETCVRVLKELKDDPALTQWESDFIDSNLGRADFTDRQREVIATFMEKYEV